MLRKDEEISRQKKEAEEEARELKRKKEEEAQRKKWDAEASEREEKLKEEERNLERIRKRVEIFLLSTTSSTVITIKNNPLYG